MSSKDEKQEEFRAEARLAVEESRKERLSGYFTLAAAAFGLINEGYQLSVMTMSNVVFQMLYPKEYTLSVATRVSNAILFGAIVGQVLVGLVCDRIGRKTALVGTTLFIAIGALIGTAAHGAHGSVNGLFWCLTIARGITGVGTGGELPASTTSASEAANEKMLGTRGPVFVMVTTFVMNIGVLLSVIVFLIVLSAAGENHLNTVWRVCFGIGAVLPLTVFYFRLRMVSTKLYKRGAIKRRVPYWLTIKRYWRVLIGTCSTWFLLGFSTVPNGMFSASILASVIRDGSLMRIAEWQLLFNIIALPGVFIGVALCNKLGRRNTLMIGFGGYVVLGLIIGLLYHKISKIIPLFVVFYGLMLSFGNLGPADMVILVTAESFATPVRGSLYGLSCAIGTVGAAVGIQVFTSIQLHFGSRWTFVVVAICGFIGIVVTWLCIPDMTGRDLADEDAAFLEYLTQNGWEGHVGEEDSITVTGTTIMREGSDDKVVESKA